MGESYLVAIRYTNGEEQSSLSEVLVEGVAGHTWANRRVEIIGRHLCHSVHVCHGDGHTPLIKN